MKHEAILKALRTIGTLDTYVTVLEDMYTGASARVHMDNEVSEKIPLLRGVRHGNQVSTKLFTAPIQEVFKNAQLELK